MNLIIIILCAIALLLLILYNKKEYITNNTTLNKLIYTKVGFHNKNINIPLNIYQTWTTLNLPPKMKETVEELKAVNPEFNHYLYDDEMCRDFIKEHFNKDVLYAFDKLIPGAFKADLFRYCVLYINGGIYLDIKYRCVNDFKLIYLTDKEYFVKDRLRDDEYGIYQALLVCYPYNNILLNCINDIINNVKNNYYTLDSSGDLMISGPFLMNRYFRKNEVEKFNLTIGFVNNNIFYNNVSVLESYKEYRTEQTRSLSTHYSYLYKQINIYNYYKLISEKTYKFNYQRCNIINKDNYIIIGENNNSTYNLLVDSSFNKISENMINNNNIYNIKLFIYNNDIYYIGNIIDNNTDDYNISCNLYDIKSNELQPKIIITNYKTDYKNWSLFNYKNELCIINNWYPLNIFNITTNENHKIYNLPEIFKNINNSTNGIIYNNQYWFVLQLYQQYNTNENYQHFFAIFDLDMKLIKYSELFKLYNSNIEQCNSIIIENDNMILSYTIETNSYISSININNNIIWHENKQEFSILI